MQTVNFRASGELLTLIKTIVSVRSANGGARNQFLCAPGPEDRQPKRNAVLSLYLDENIHPCDAATERAFMLASRRARLGRTETQATRRRMPNVKVCRNSYLIRRSDLF